MNEIAYSDFTQGQVLEAAAVYTLRPSDVRHVDVRTLAQRHRDLLDNLAAPASRTLVQHLRDVCLVDDPDPRT